MIALGSVLLLAGGNFLADNLIKGLRAAEQQRIEAGWKEYFERRALHSPWLNPTVGCHYTWEGLARYGLPTQLTFRGWSNTPAELPLAGNLIGDFRRVKNNDHIWVWGHPFGAALHWSIPEHARRRRVVKLIETTTTNLNLPLALAMGRFSRALSIDEEASVRRLARWNAHATWSFSNCARNASCT